MTAIIAPTISDLRAALQRARPAFVPTMGALHEGHLALVRRASGLGGPVVVSVFVNPAQFAPGEDYARYPRQLERDVELCAAAGAEIVFAPPVSEIYPLGEERVAGDFTMPPLPPAATLPRLEDAFRPSHFAGVCRVVARLFDIVQPSHAVFGEKDYQQLLVISEMVRERNACEGRASPRWRDLRIVAHPTIREDDGLAMSSRNVYLPPQKRQRALALWRALNEAALAPRRSAELVMRGVLQQHELEIDYAAVRDAGTLLPIDDASPARAARALIAARLGSVRLVDNLPLPDLAARK